MLTRKTHKYFDFHFEDSKSLISLKYQIYQDKSIAIIFFEHIKSFLESEHFEKINMTMKRFLYLVTIMLNFIQKLNTKKYNNIKKTSKNQPKQYNNDESRLIKANESFLMDLRILPLSLS